VNPATVLYDVVWAAALWAGAITGGIVLAVIGIAMGAVKGIPAAIRHCRARQARNTAHTATTGPDSLLRPYWAHTQPLDKEAA
jgi:hypothetical protein